MNKPFGFKILNSVLAAPFNSSIIELIVEESDPTPIFVNDVVRTVNYADSTGIEICTRSFPGESVRGIVVGIAPSRESENRVYRKANTRQIVQVCQDPFILCRAMVNDAVDGNYINYTMNIDNGTGDVNLGISGLQLNYSTLIPDGHQFRITKILEVVDNGVDKYSIVECIIVDHELIKSRVATHTYWIKSGDDLIPDFEANVNLLDAGRGKQFLDPIDDQDVVTKHYLIDYIDTHPYLGLWEKVSEDLVPETVGDNVNLQQGGRGKGFLDPVDDYDVVNKRWLINYLQNFPVLAATPQVEELVVTSDGQTVFLLDFTPLSPAAITISVNGVMYYANFDSNNYGFDISGVTVTWTEPDGLVLKTWHRVMVHYNYVFAQPIPPVPANWSKRDIVNVTASTYIHDLDTDLAKVFTNKGNTGTVTFILPAPTVDYKGFWMEYLVLDGKFVHLQAPAGEPFLYNIYEIPELITTNKGARLTVMVTNELRWSIVSIDNNWNFTP